MQATDFAFVIVLFVLFDLVFYLVVVKGMMVKSIIGKEDQQRRIRDKNAPVFVVEILHGAVNASANTAGSDITTNTADSHNLLKQEVKNLSLEKIDFLPPLELMVGIPTKVDVLVNQNFSDHLTQILKKADAGKISTLKVGAYLTAKLNAEGFQITSGTQSEQLATGENRWEWQVIPTKAGQVTMGIDLNIRVEIPNGEESRHFAWPGSAVHVTANAVYMLKHVFKNYGWWILATVLGISAYVYFRFF